MDHQEEIIREQILQRQLVSVRVLSHLKNSLNLI